MKQNFCDMSQNKIFYFKVILKCTIIIITILFLYLFKNKAFDIHRNKGENIKRKKIGIIGLNHHYNAGNMILKYAMATKLKQIGFDPYIIGVASGKINISFLSQFINIRITKNFSDIKPHEYDILMVNSDQTWRIWNKKYYLHIGFLKFAQNWNIKKFVYGASIGNNNAYIPSNILKEAKLLIKNFSGFSVRENGTIPLIKKYFDINPLFVLDPTLLIDKNEYLKLIRYYKGDFDINKKYIFHYNLRNKGEMIIFLNKSSKSLNYTIFSFDTNRKDFIQRFIYYIYNSKAVITDSYHGTIFSIIFNKPFISFQNSVHDERFNSLNEIFSIRNRIIKNKEKPNISLLTTPLNINYDKFNKMRNISNNFLEEQLCFLLLKKTK